MALNQYIIETTTRPFPKPTDPNDMQHTISPASGYGGFGINWPGSGAIPNSFSNASWGYENRTFAQQTFLGASIRSFSMNGGFGDTSSTLTVELINDEFNNSDGLGPGLGDDVYHSGGLQGIHDRFAPPPVGSPVFFKFGNNFATVSEAYVQTFDELYGYPSATTTTTTPSPQGEWNPNNFKQLTGTQKVRFKNSPPVYVDIQTEISDSNTRGRRHLVFGGILQSYTQNKGLNGNPLFSVQVVDPREILSNVVLILNDYAGPIYSTPNVLNIYGFLEHNPTQDTKQFIKNQYPVEQILTKMPLNGGGIRYNNTDIYTLQPNTPRIISSSSLAFPFPITGTGFSRRSTQGIPYYRVEQAVNTLMGYNGTMPQEYIDAGYGGAINFRGYNYVVDFGGLPRLPELYYLDFDQINLLDLALEICEITSRDLYVTLLPVINHPQCEFLLAYNDSKAQSLYDKSKIIAGIIRLDTVDRSKPPRIGAIKTYLDNLATQGIYTESQDIGFELSNNTTNKFVVGAQEVDMYYFSTNSDRGMQYARPNGPQEPTNGYQWKLDTSLRQQVLPYYGKLGQNAVTIPKGFGPYQQILLDATGLNANGVGSYYVATEMELRCALVSFERWKEFLKIYNDTYLESLEDNDAEDSAALLQASAPPGEPPIDDISNNYAVTVPRSVFDTFASVPFGPDKLPKSPCNPPYGYPLYYKRMTKLGIPEGGLTNIQTRYTTVLNILGTLKSADGSNFKATINSAIAQLREIKEGTELTAFERAFFNDIENKLNSLTNIEDITQSLVIIDETIENFKPIMFSPDLCKLAKKNNDNALKVYNFLRNIAEECLGKKFLVKIPNEVNTYYQTSILGVNGTYTAGPFGFKPRPVGSNIGFEYTQDFLQQVVAPQRQFAGINPVVATVQGTFIEGFLSSGYIPNPSRFTGALKANYNPIADKYEFNYRPSPEGGFTQFDLYQNLFSAYNSRLIHATSGWGQLPSGVRNGLVPIDLTNFINENGRVSAYVRFDNSEHLSFDQLNPSDFVQQVVVNDNMIPDLCESLDNVKPGTFYSFPTPNNNQNLNPANPSSPLIKSIAFVKCSLDSELYMPPKTYVKNTYVYAGNPIQIKRKVLPRKVYDPCTDTYSDSFSYYKSHFIPDTGRKPVALLDFAASSGVHNDVLPNVASLDGKLINTTLGDLDTEHVYALITLPARIIPTKDARFRDGPFQAANADRFKHFMTMDVVKGLDGFDTPGFPPQPPKSILRNFNDQVIPADVRVQAWLAAKKANDSLISFGFPQTLNASIPSPVYPDLVALPLLSTERCYGPWISSYLNVPASGYTNVGGRVEFIKDENLSPWNYAGYDLMNYAGHAQAEFTNNLSLFSERGGFVIPGRPVGASLGRALLDGGPLVTNIQVDVSDAGVRTTYKLDLYTANFGKLQKQKQDLLTKISRERQKLRDERNSLIRMGIGKNQTQVNYGQQYSQLRQGMSNALQSIGNGISSALSNIAMTVRPYEQRRWSSNPSIGDNGEHHVINHSVEGSLVTNNDIQTVMQSYIGEAGLANSYMNSAVVSWADIYMPASKEEYHPNMPAQPNPYPHTKQSLYFDDNSPFKPEDIA